MPDQVELITTLAWGLGLSLIFGYLVSLIRMPALVGYLLAGVFLAPTTPGIVGNLDLASQLSEVGVILLMFGVGLHFSLRDLLQVREVAIPGAIFQMAATTIVGTLAAYFVWDWTFVGSLVIGVALSCASVASGLVGCGSGGRAMTASTISGVMTSEPVRNCSKLIMSAAL